MRLAVITFLTLLSFVTQAQLSKWLVPDVNGSVKLVDFAPPVPVVSVPLPNYGPGGPPNECPNIMTDAVGNVLFSFVPKTTNTLEVRNSLYQIMPNGTSLICHPSTFENFILHTACDTNKYLIIQPNAGVPYNLYYSIIDISLDGGLGDVSTANVLIGDNFIESVDVSHQRANGCRWMYSVRVIGNSFDIVRFTITDTIIGDSITVENFTMNNPQSVIAFEIELSPDNSKLAISTFRSTASTSPDIIVWDHDLATGTVSNRQDFMVPGKRTFPLEFSPDNTKVYFATNHSGSDGTLGRVDLITQVVDVIDNTFGRYGKKMELVWNNKLYIGNEYSKDYLAEIANPNDPNIANIQYTENAVYISNMTRAGIPSTVDGEVPSTSINPQYIEFGLVPTGNCDEFHFVDSVCMATWMEWDFGDSVISNLDDPIHQYAISGLYDITLKVVACGDTLVLTKQVFIGTMTLDIGPDTTLCDTASLTLNAGNPGASYIWSSGNTTQTIIVTSSGTYSVTVTDSICTVIDTINIILGTSPIVSITGNNLLCGGASSTLSASGGDTYLWSTGDTSASIGVSPMVNTKYYVTISNTCGSSIDSITVYVYPGTLANAETDTTIKQGESVQLYGSGGLSYSWNPPDWLSCIDCPNPIASPQITTTYCVTVTDINGCAAEDCVTIIVEELICDHPFVPNVFSPNGDGNNDLVFVRGDNFIIEKFIIYDRWGEKVFETEDVSIGWDGQFRGKKMNPAVYVWYLEVLCVGKEEPDVYKGNITLVR